MGAQGSYEGISRIPQHAEQHTATLVAPAVRWVKGNNGRRQRANHGLPARTLTSGC